MLGDFLAVFCPSIFKLTQLEWWQFAYDQDGELVGFILPVIYPGSHKGSLEEATVYYMGVVPTQRGHNHAIDLLCQGTRIMQDVGVWRIYCDTSVENLPMINTFRRVGYEQEGDPKIIDG